MVNMMNNFLSTSTAKYPKTQLTTLMLYMSLSQALFFSTGVRASGDLWDMSLDELGKIRVTSIASGTKTPLDKAAAIATVITSDDIAAMGATDLDQVLETVTGLHVGRSDQSYTGKYIIRGITSNYTPQTLLLINGIPVTSLFVGNRSNAWAGMPIKSIARVEVIRGPGSALYGADAFSGVINIITKNHDELRGTQTGIRTGSFGTQAAWFTHGKSYNGLNIGFTLEAETTDGWKKIVEHDRQTEFDAMFKTNASLAPNSVSTMKDMIDARLDMSYQNSRLRLGYQGRSNIGSSVGYAEALDPTSRAANYRYNLDYNYSLKELTPKLDIDSRVSYYRNAAVITKNIPLFPAGAFGGAYPNGFIGNPGYKEENARLDLSALYSGINNHLLRVGTGFTWDDMFEVTESKNFNADLSPRANGLEDVSDTAEVYLPEKQRTNYYLFVQDEWKLAKNWLATTGIRYDHFSDFGNTTNPRLALVWATTDNITTKLLYGKAFRAPSFNELFVTTNPIVLGDPNLKAETIDTYEFAFSHQLSNQLLYTANIYRYNIQDFITYVPINSGVNQAQNIGNRKGQGFELEADYSPAYNVRFLANYAYQQSIDKKTDADIGDAPNHQIYGRSEWTIASDWHFDSQVTWVGKQQRVLGDTRSAHSAYTTVDITLRKQNVWRKLDFAVSIQNLFDANVTEPSPGPAVYIPNDFPMAGRSLYAEVQYPF
jgi:iron complex outermembrane receptor protein